MITLHDKIKNIKKSSTLDELKDGCSIDLDHFWSDFVEPHLPKEAAVKQWHKILKEYVEKDDAIYFLRAFGSPSGNSPLLRRGFLNITNYKFSAFYGDNFFTSFFYSMAYDGYAPKDCNEFETMMRDRSFPCGCIQTIDEQVLAAYKKWVNPDIAKKGYKIAHIYSAGKKYDTSAGFKTIGDFCDKVFPRGDRKDWNKIDSHGSFYRETIIRSPGDAKKIKDFLKAHFIRTVHPINYFLVPNKSNTRDKVTGIIKSNIYWTDKHGIIHDEIGEYDKLIDYVAYKISKKYGKIYDEFLNLVFPDRRIISYTNEIINAEYGPDKWKSKIVSGSCAGATTPVVTSSISTAAGKPKHKNNPSITFVPANETDFFRELIKKGQGKITVDYLDGHTEQYLWTYRSLSDASRLIGNIRSKTWYKKNKDLIKKIKCEIV